MSNCFCNDRMHFGKTLSSRREFLTRCGMGMGALGLTSLLSDEVLGQVKATHFPAKAKHVIHIFAAGRAVAGGHLGSQTGIDQTARQAVARRDRSGDGIAVQVRPLWPVRH